MKIKNLLFFFAITLLSQTPMNAQWESLGNNLIISNYRVWSIKVAPDKSIWTISSFDAFPPAGRLPIVHRSDDGGNNWTVSNISAAISNYGWDISPIDKMNAFTCVHDAGLFQTENGGISWNKTESYPYRAYSVHFFNSDEGWVLGTDNTADRLLVMSVTSDGGKTWIHSGRGVGQPEGTSIPSITNDDFGRYFSNSSSYGVHNNTIILGRSLGNYWKSEDKGYNWTNHSTPLVSQGIMASNIAMKDENTFMVAGDIKSSDASGVPARNFTTKDGGLTWDIAGLSGMTAADTKYVPNSGSVFIMVGHNNFGWGDEGTAISYDFGETWDRIDNTSLIAIDFLDENTAFGSCCNNFWPTANGQIHRWNFDVSTSTMDIVEPSLVKIMPNPVSDELKISTGEQFQAKTLMVDVISINGQSVLSKEYPNKSDIYIPTRNFAKGFYTLRVTGDKKSVVKKFIKE